MGELTANSPLEIEIILFYHCTSFADHGLISTEIGMEVINKMINAGLIRASEKDGVTYEVNREASQVYVDALLSVSLPVKKWVIERQKPLVENL